MKRCRAPEIMDEPDIERERLFGALRGLARLNRWSGGVNLFWPTLRDLAREVAPRPLRILDLASGGGDLLLGLWRQAAQNDIALELMGTDLSPHAVEFARNQAAQVGASIEFEVLNAVTDPLPSGFDVVMNSLFLHHLDEPEVVIVLRRMAEAAERMVLVSDLIRTGPCWLLVAISAKLLCSSEVNHIDARRSASAAYTRSEMRTLAQEAGLDYASVVTRIPCRFLLTWYKPVPALSPEVDQADQPVECV